HLMLHAIFHRDVGIGDDLLSSVHLDLTARQTLVHGVERPCEFQLLAVLVNLAAAETEPERRALPAALVTLETGRRWDGCRGVRRGHRNLRGRDVVRGVVRVAAVAVRLV